MKALLRFLILAMIAMGLGNYAVASSSEAVKGRWRFTSMIVGGEELPPRDPKLLLIFEFFSDGTDRLYWTFDRGKTFCERRGRYQYDGRVLTDRVEWVNPSNEARCSSDPDMREGNETMTKAEADATSFRLHLPFGQEEIIYIFSHDPQS